MPTAYAEGRIIRFLSRVYDSSKGILGVDVGASAATVAAAFGGELTLGVYPQLGLGEGLANLLRFTSLNEILKWIPLDIPAETVREYLYQKSIYPASLPATPEDLAIEQALVRQNLSVALNSLARDFPLRVRRAATGLTPYFEPILACGSAITRAPTLGQSLLDLVGCYPADGYYNHDPGSEQPAACLGCGRQSQFHSSNPDTGIGCVPRIGNGDYSLFQRASRHDHPDRPSCLPEWERKPHRSQAGCVGDIHIPGRTIRALVLAAFASYRHRLWPWEHQCSRHPRDWNGPGCSD